MTTIHAGYSLSNPNVKPLDMSQAKITHVSEMPQEMFERMTKAQERILESRYTTPPDTVDHPLYQPYATIEKNRKTIATIDNYGGVSSSNAVGAKIQRILSQDDTNISGPAGAQERAEKLAKMLGGEIKIAETALTQNQFRATPQPTATVDYAAMKQDPMYEQLQKTRQARTEFIAQQIAQDTYIERTQIAAAEEKTPQEPSMYETAAKDFMDYMEKTPEERYFEAILADKGLTKEELDALPPEEKAKILEEIKEEIKKRLATDAVERTKKEGQEA